jgi:hypothetical protein
MKYTKRRANDSAAHGYRRNTTAAGGRRDAGRELWPGHARGLRVGLALDLLKVILTPPCIFH